MVLALSASTFARNTEEKVENVTEARTLTTPIDLIITNSNNAVTGTIDIANENAAVIFANVNPQTVINKYLSKITINGAAATANSNCRVAIYRHGAMVLPHGRSFAALTVYTDKDFQGESRTFSPGARQVLTGKWNNAIQSIKLKRGYMATLANHADGTGYSHCYIADREDIEINLRAEQAGRTTMLRVFKWNYPSKKGCCDAREAWMMDNCKATWYYDWGAGTTQRTNHEYVPQRHHEAGESNGQGWKGAWESWSQINAGDETCTHVLGQNEPDNTSGAGEVYTYVSKIPDNPREKCSNYTLTSVAKEFLYSGKRIGTFACCNPSTGWVKEYVDYCRENNIRVDFVATHYYIGGQSPQGCIDRLWQLHNVTGLPVWATEWNNGANWSGEGGFSTDAGWYQWGTGNDNAKNGEWLRDVLRRADKPENTNWLERLAVYNAVEGRREIFTNGQITAGGKIWGEYESSLAYDSEAGSINYFMPWTHHAPKDLEATYNKNKATVKLTWNNPNSDITEFAVIERKEGSKWVPVDTLPLNDNEAMEHTIDVSTLEPGLHELRINNNDLDGKKRQSNTTTFTISAAYAVGAVQFGQLKLGNTDIVSTDLTGYDAAPNVIMGLVSNVNTGNGITNQVTTVTTKSFGFRLYPWALKEPASIAKAETVDYLVLPDDTIIHLPGNMMLISAKTPTNIKGDVVTVNFPEPFPAGVTPVVVAQQMTSVKSYAPVTVQISNVTNTGFDIKLVRQEAATGTFAAQKVMYYACTPGECSIGGGKMLTVCRNDNKPVGGTARLLVPFINAQGEELTLTEPYVIAAPQTNNFAATTVMRQASLSKDESGFVVGGNYRRQVDPTTTCKDANTAAASGDLLGFFIISNDPDGTSEDAPIITAIHDVINQAKAFAVSVSRGVIQCDKPGVSAYNAAGQRVTVGKRVPAGVYVVTDGRSTQKVVVK